MWLLYLLEIWHHSLTVGDFKAIDWAQKRPNGWIGRNWKQFWKLHTALTRTCFKTHWHIHTQTHTSLHWECQEMTGCVLQKSSTGSFSTGKKVLYSVSTSNGLMLLKISIIIITRAIIYNQQDFPPPPPHKINVDPEEHTHSTLWLQL